MPIYMRYSTIKGEVRESAHAGWIELSSAQLGVGRRSNPAREQSAPNVSEIVVTKVTDSASNALYRESLSGKGVVAVIDFVKDDTVYLRLTLSNTLIASFSMSGHGDRPTESLTLNFTKIEFERNPGTPPP